MKHFEKSVTLLFVVVIVLAACASNAAASGIRSSGTAGDSGNFSDVAGRDWRLAELRSAGSTVTINRASPASFPDIDLSEWFSIRFQDGQVNGRAAPNTYGGPYTEGSGGVLDIGLLRSTMMASFYEMEALKEHGYFAYLHNVYRWNLANGNLELYSRGADGVETVLVFAPAR